MFIFRWITTFFAILGVILFGALFFFSFKPLQSTYAKSPTISDILNCTEETFLKDAYSITETNINELKNILGPSTPIELVRDLSNTLNNITSSVGTISKINVKYCQLDTDEALNVIENFLKKDSVNYDSGSFDSVITKINEIPYVNIGNLNLTTSTVVARSTKCNRPVNRSNFLIFTNIPSGDSNFVVLFDIELAEKSDSNTYQKAAGNLLITGQYLREKISCHE